MALESLLSYISQGINDLESRSTLIQGHRFWYQSKARIHIPISGQWQLGPYLAPFQIYGGLNVENRHFPIPIPIPAKILGCSLWSRSVMLGSAESEKVRLISREIIFAEFHPI